MWESSTAPQGSKKNKKKRKKSKKKKQPEVEDDNTGQVDIIQKEVDQIAQIMVSNIDKMLDRGDALDDLMVSVEDLEAQAKGFQVVAKQVKKKEMWKYRKQTIILTIIVILILGGIAGVVLLILKPW
ncbi:vesicle-associated membrane protein 8-like [Diadema antillarum]|uniref:vesicle-associated membrane protein 8-like n=1 Tax=Diadema antillarum TaxID=105358 RepID=UPI003A862B63